MVSGLQVYPNRHPEVKIAGYQHGSPIIEIEQLESVCDIDDQGNMSMKGMLDASERPCKLKIFSQDTQPEVPPNTIAFWWDTEEEKMHLIVAMDGKRFVVELGG